jgi:hypothetical protein
MSGFKVKAVAFEIAIEVFGPHADAIQTHHEGDGHAVSAIVGEQEPPIKA